MEDYSDAKAAAQLIFEDLKKAIDNEFPAQQLTLLERERLDHEVFAESRAKVYIDRQEYYDRLDSHALETGNPLVVLGESGSGKTALLANWVFRFRKKYPDTFILTHFIGSSTYSTDYAAMLLRIMMEIKERYDLPNDIPEKPDELRAQFPNWLSMAATHGKFILVLDALNQLEDKDNAPDLVWLPEFIPPEVRLVLSTLPGRSLDALRKRGWPTMGVQLLEPMERQQLINDYLLKLYSKRLPQDLVKLIASKEQCANPLFLHALLEELRIFGKHEEIAARISHYLQADNTGTLYELVLTRLEEDYEKDYPGLVGEAMQLLWAARRGLSEPELLEIMDIPPLTWSPLSLALQDSLVTRSGLLTFFHDFLRQAVYAKYIKTSETEKASHLRLANYFEKQEVNLRKIDEFPWQLAEAQEWKMLQDCLTDLPFFQAAYEHNKFEVLAYWQKIEDNSELTCPSGYGNVLAEPEKFIDILNPLAELFYERGNLNEAMKLWEALGKWSRATGDTENIQASLGSRAVIFINRGELDEAMKLLKEQEQICRELGNQHGLCVSLGNQAVIFINRGELDEAMKLLKEKEQICRTLDNKDGLWVSLANQSAILHVRSEFDEAMKLLKEQEQICRELGDKHGLQASLGNQSVIFVLYRGELDEAMKLLKEQEQICRELGNKHGLAQSLGGQALILKDRGELEEAMKLFKEEEQIYKELGNKYGLQSLLGMQSLIVQDRGKFDEAMTLLKEQEHICRNLENKYELQISIGNRAWLLKACGELEEAMKLFKEQERICRYLKNKDELVKSLAIQALIFQEQGKLDEAMKLLKETERICRELDNKDGLWVSLSNQALILYDRGEIDEALKLLKEQERICRELGNKDGLQLSFTNQSDILYDRGELDEAMKLLKEQESICMDLDDKDMLSISLAKQAEILGVMGQPENALKLAEEAFRIATEHGFISLAQQIKPILDNLRRSKLK